jgi:hypothetical protein
MLLQVTYGPVMLPVAKRSAHCHIGGKSISAIATLGLAQYPASRTFSWTVRQAQEAHEPTRNRLSCIRERHSGIIELLAFGAELHLRGCSSCRCCGCPSLRKGVCVLSEEKPSPPLYAYNRHAHVYRSRCSASARGPMQASKCEGGVAAVSQSLRDAAFRSMMVHRAYVVKVYQISLPQVMARILRMYMKTPVCIRQGLRGLLAAGHGVVETARDFLCCRTQSERVRQPVHDAQHDIIMPMQCIPKAISTGIHVLNSECI